MEERNVTERERHERKRGRNADKVFVGGRGVLHFK